MNERSRPAEREISSEQGDVYADRARGEPGAAMRDRRDVVDDRRDRRELREDRRELREDRREGREYDRR